MLPRSQTIQIDVDMKSPNIIVPEFGCQDKGGQLLVIDLGSLRINSDLQASLDASMNVSSGVSRWYCPNAPSVWVARLCGAGQGVCMYWAGLGWAGMGWDGMGWDLSG